MAELVFVSLYTDNSTELSDVCIGSEPDNTITKFYIEAQRQGNMQGAVSLSDYDNIKWERFNGLMTSHNVTAIGIKTFPQIGAIGFYRLKYEPKSLILAPIYTKDKRYNAPTIVIKMLAASIKITLSNPKDVTYDCYRVVLRNGYFTEEYVTYESEIEVPMPTTGGVYSIVAFGYIEERLASRESVAQFIAVDGEADVLYDTEILATDTGKAILFGDTLIIL